MISFEHSIDVFIRPKKHQRFIVDKLYKGNAVERAKNELYVYIYKTKFSAFRWMNTAGSQHR